MKNTSATIVLLGSMLLGASAFPGIRAGLESYSPSHLALLRFLIASLILAVVAIGMRIRLPRPADLPRMMLLGLLGFAIYHVALNTGELTVTAGAASFIVCTVPIFNVVLSMFILKERMRPAAWVGMAISMFGVGLITFGESGELRAGAGALLILVAAIAQSLYFVLQKPLLERYTPFEVVSYAAWFGTTFMLVLSPGLGEAIRQATAQATWSVVYLGVAPGALAYVGWTFALSRMGVTRMSSFLYLIPVIAMVIGYLWLGEVPTSLSLLGGPIALAGVIFAARPARPKVASPAAGTCVTPAVCTGE